MNFTQRLRGRKPVKGLRANYRIHRLIIERDLLSGTGPRVDLGELTDELV